MTAPIAGAISREELARLVRAPEQLATAEDVVTLALRAASRPIRDAADAPRIVCVPFVHSHGSPVAGRRTTRRSNDAGVSGTYTQQLTEDWNDDS